MAMAGYTKLFSSIVASTIWRADDKTRIVWVTMLAMSDRWGVVEASVPGLADLARVSVEECRAAILALQEPDPDSRSHEQEGRRLETVDGGWRLINHSKYRDKLSVDEQREYHKLYQRQYRKRKHDVKTNPDGLTKLIHTAPAPDTKAKAVRTTDLIAPSALRARFEVFWRAYPRKIGKAAAWAVWQRQKPDDVLTARIIAVVADQSRSVQWLTDGGKYIPHPITWLRQGRWQDGPIEPVPQVNAKTARTLTSGAAFIAGVKL